VVIHTTTQGVLNRGAGVTSLKFQEHKQTGSSLRWSGNASICTTEVDLVWGVGRDASRRAERPAAGRRTKEPRLPLCSRKDADSSKHTGVCSAACRARTTSYLFSWLEIRKQGFFVVFFFYFHRAGKKVFMSLWRFFCDAWRPVTSTRETWYYEYSPYLCSPLFFRLQITSERLGKPR